MKKKIKIPKGFEVSKVIDHSKSVKPRITINLKKESNFGYEPYIKPLEELLEKAKKDYYDGVMFICGHSGWYVTSKGDGFEFLGDNQLRVSTDMGKSRVYHSDFGWAEITKKPVIKVQDKWLYEGDEYWYVQTHNNFKLNHSKIEKKSKEMGFLDSVITFLTKQSALEYVLEEAKSRFEGVSTLRWFDSDLIKEFNYDSIKISDYSENIDTKKWCIWTPGEGFIAEPVKEPKLMLGKYDVEIEQTIIQDKNSSSGWTVPMIKCNGGQVTKEEWMEWHKQLKNCFELPEFYGSAGSYLSEYQTFIDLDTKMSRIGCIENVTIEQIQAITDKLNSL